MRTNTIGLMLLLGFTACAGQTGMTSAAPQLENASADDADGDGIANTLDACPNSKGPASPEPKLNGCPDRDEDKIPDDEDSCPDFAGIPSKIADEHGCPDRDGDGIPDVNDACRFVVGKASAIPDDNGCPDSDGDGIADARDRCPKDPRGDQPDPLREGCPLKDDDSDGIANSQDNCPAEAGPQSNQGCPLEKKQLVAITKEKLEIKEKVYFASGNATILPRSFGLLGQIAKILSEHPEVGRVLVEGHTDSKGSAELNRRLSLDRALAVRTFLVGKGVAEARLEAQGHGPDRPAAPNETVAGREKNRRVELNIVEEPRRDPRDAEAKPDDRAVKSPPPPTPPTPPTGGTRP